MHVGARLHGNHAVAQCQQELGQPARPGTDLHDGRRCRQPHRLQRIHHREHAAEEVAVSGLGVERLAVQVDVPAVILQPLGIELRRQLQGGEMLPRVGHQAAGAVVQGSSWPEPCTPPPEASSGVARSRPRL